MSDNVSLDDDWQSKMSVPACYWVMYLKQVNCDVFFEVGTEQERAGCHSTILMARSKGFFSMFAGGLPEREIELPEVQIEEFNSFLQYLYTEELKVTGISIEKVMFLAEKYQVKELIKLLLSRQLETMDVDDFCPFVKKNENHMTDLVKFKCLEYAFKQPFAVFRCGTFTLLPFSFLKELLEHERLVMDEEVICTAVLLWATKECELRRLDVKGENQRKVLGDALYLIRFPLVSQDYFTGNISETGLLTDHDEVQLLKYFLSPKKVGDNFKFNIKKREAPASPFSFVSTDEAGPRIAGGLHTVQSFPILSPADKNDLHFVYRFAERGIGWGYRANRKDAIAFVATREINLTHVYLYGNCKEDGTLDVSLVLRDNLNEFSSTETKIQCKMSNATGLYEVGVENSVGSYGVRLNANVEYHIVVTVNGGNTYYGKNGKTKCYEDGIEIEFKNSEFSTNNTNTNIGQIAGMKYNIL